ncbi:Nucleosomal histone kinase 1 [Sergentomyia squamirostris]
MASKPKAKAPARGRKKVNGYARPARVPPGTILTDLDKKQWRIGPVIGSGGFGDIYSCCDATNPSRSTDKYPAVVKIEPQENGPLFVEMHFYIRNTKSVDIEEYRKTRGLKNLGMPRLLGSGSQEFDAVKHRFLVLGRYGSDIWSIFINNGRQFPQHTVYRLAIQMLDVLEYVHGKTYIHGDLKGANILLEFGKSDPSQVYLVDFGLATHFTTKDYKPDPKQMHNGTIEYTSRDAHNGVPTRRGDLEILGYNLIQWCVTKLPWEAADVLKVPTKVQEAKEKFMSDVEKSLKNLGCPPTLTEFMVHVKELKHDQSPNYDKLRRIFEKGLKSLGKTNAGALDFSMTPSPTKKVKSVKKEATNMMSPKRRNEDVQDIRTSPVKRARVKQEKNTPPPKVDTPSPKKKSSTNVKTQVLKNSTKKHYTVNVELDISLDADVLVNVQRKPRTAPTRKSPRTAVSTPKVTSDDDECIPASEETPPRRNRVAGRKGKTLISVGKEL